MIGVIQRGKYNVLLYGRMNCARKLLLTGTPVQNDLNEYYCLVSTVVPGLLGSKQDFNAQFISR